MVWVRRWGAPVRSREEGDTRALSLAAPTSSGRSTLLESDYFLWLVLHGIDDPKELGKACCVSRAWRDACSSDHMWMRLYQARWGFPLRHEKMLTWKDQCKRALRLGMEKPVHKMQWTNVGAMVNSVCVVDGRIVIGDDNSAIHCLSMPESLELLESQSRAQEGVSAAPVSASGPPALPGVPSPRVSQGTPSFSVKDSHVHSFQHAEEGDPQRLWSVFPAGEGRVFSAGVDTVVRLWSVESGDCIREYRGHGSSVSSISAQGNKLVSASADRTLKIWDAHSGACLDTLEGHTGVVTSVATTPDVIVSGSADATCRVWDLRTGRLLHTLKGHTGQVRAVAAQGGTVVSGSWDSTVRVWDLSTGACSQVLHGTEAVWSLAMSGDLIVSGEKEGTIKMWDAGTWQCKHTLHAHGGLVRSVCIGADALLSVSDDGNLEWYDLCIGA